MKFFGKRKGGVLLIAVLYALLLPACAKRTEVTKVSLHELQGNLKYENVVFKEFDTVTDISSNPDALDQCQESAMQYLYQTGIFKRVGKESSPSYEEPCVIVEATLTDLKIVSTTRRIFTGILSGRSYMKIKVRLIDSATGSVIATKELEGSPASMGSAWSFGKSDRALPGKMGVLLGEFILSNVGEE